MLWNVKDTPQCYRERFGSPCCFWSHFPLKHHLLESRDPVVFLELKVCGTASYRKKLKNAWAMYNKRHVLGYVVVIGFGWSVHRIISLGVAEGLSVLTLERLESPRLREQSCMEWRESKRLFLGHVVENGECQDTCTDIFKAIISIFSVLSHTS